MRFNDDWPDVRIRIVGKIPFVERLEEDSTYHDSYILDFCFY